MTSLSDTTSKKIVYSTGKRAFYIGSQSNKVLELLCTFYSHLHSGLLYHLV